MQRRVWRHIPLIATALAGLALGLSSPAQASTPQSGEINIIKPLSVQRASTEQVKAMAADGSGALLTLQGTPKNKTGNGTAGILDVTCFLGVGTPFGGGAPTAPVLVDGIVICDDFVDTATLEIQLYRDDNLVASDRATFPFTPGIQGRIGIPNCVPGRYFGAATAVVARFDLTPPVIAATKRSANVQIGCG